MSSLLTSQSVVLATAMAAVSGTVILLAAIRHQKTHPRPCLSSSSDDGSNNLMKIKTKKKKKRVHFAEDVVEPIGDGAEFRKRHRNKSSSSGLNSNRPDIENDSVEEEEEVVIGRITGMPANRVALYSGMLRDRVGHRLAYSSY